MTRPLDFLILRIYVQFNNYQIFHRGDITNGSKRYFGGNMKNVSLICCAILCCLAVGSVSALDIQARNVRSTETILPSEAFDAAQAAFEMDLLYQHLVPHVPKVRS